MHENTYQISLENTHLSWTVHFDAISGYVNYGIFWLIKCYQVLLYPHLQEQFWKSPYLATAMYKMLSKMSASHELGQWGWFTSILTLLFRNLIFNPVSYYVLFSITCALQSITNIVKIHEHVTENICDFLPQNIQGKCNATVGVYVFWSDVETLQCCTVSWTQDMEGQPINNKKSSFPICSCHCRVMRSVPVHVQLLGFSLWVHIDKPSVWKQCCQRPFWTSLVSALVCSEE